MKKYLWISLTLIIFTFTLVPSTHAQRQNIRPSPRARIHISYFAAIIGQFETDLKILKQKFASLLLLAQAQEKKPERRGGEIIVKVKNDVPLTSAFQQKLKIRSSEKILNRHKPKGKAKEAIEKAGLDRLYIFATDEADVSSILETLKRDPNIEYAEANGIVRTQLIPNDPQFQDLWGLHNIGQSGGIPNADIDAPEAWDTTHDSNFTVGVIDTGIDPTHPDLKDNLWVNPAEIAGNSVDDDGNGFIDDVNGWNFVANSGAVNDDNGHGTHISGTIGARGNNDIGIAGINWSVKIVALKFLDANGSGYVSDAVRAIAYANMMSLKITNNSWGSPFFFQSLYDSIASAHVAGNLFVAAAGNNASNSDVFPFYPAAFDLPNIISVAAIDRRDALASFSNYGFASVDLGAPGSEIVSTVPIGACRLCSATGYAPLNGTSMAAPHAAGLAALAWSSAPTLSHLQIKDKLLSLVIPTSALQGKTLSGGRLNAYNLFDNDTTAPAAVTDLAVVDPQADRVLLTWTAVGDDGLTGQAIFYDLRWSTAPIDESNFSSAQPATGVPQPAPAGTRETVAVTGLDQQTTYYFGLKVRDNVGRVSSLSNTVSAKTISFTPIFSDTVESDTSGWITGGLWHRETYRSNSQVTSFAFNSGSPSYVYTSGSLGSLITPSVNLTRYRSARATFSHWYQTGPYARRSVLVGVNGIYQMLAPLSSDNPMNLWQTYRVDLTPFVGNADVRLSFFFQADSNTTSEGWYVDDLIIEGVPNNNTPVADAGPDQTGFAGQTLNFNGGASNDPDGDPLNYAWDFGDGATASEKTASHAFVNPGVYTVTLTVADQFGAQSSDTVRATITADKVTITKATYSTAKKQITVEATSSKSGEAILTVANFGTMTYNARSKIYKFTAKGVAYQPTITVISSYGGLATAAVIQGK